MAAATTTSRQSYSRRSLACFSTLGGFLLMVMITYKSPLAEAPVVVSPKRHKEEKHGAEVVNEHEGEEEKDGDASAMSAETVQTATAEGHQLPQVAWIMSFGGSGTSFTITNTEEVSGVSTGSNYAADYDPCVPIHANWTHGPFLRSPKKDLPSSFILTKTHCMGYCMDCREDFTTTTFDQKCRTAKTPTGAVVYESSIPKRAVHLFRDPFDNLIGRMHLHNKLILKGRKSSNGIAYNTTATGLADWCRYLDDKYPFPELKSPDLTCRTEWFKYVSWHNEAYRTAVELYKMPVHYLFYEDYEKLNETTQQLCRFLQLDCPRKPLNFQVGHSYRSIFGSASVQAAAEYVRQAALPEVYKHLRHYFE